MKPQSRSSPLARVVRTTRGCDLNSDNESEITMVVCYNTGEGNQLLPTTGPGEGCDPTTPHEGTSVLGLVLTNPPAVTCS